MTAPLAVDPRRWLVDTSTLALGDDLALIARIWAITPDYDVVRARLLERPLGDRRLALSTASALLPVAANRGDLSLLDTVLVQVARVIVEDVSSGRFAIVAMSVFLSPPLARAETFTLLCETLGGVPCGA